MEKREDRRILMTKRMLKAALIEMLKDKDIYHISIRELCEKADVNRTTFYKYYGSQFDLLADMENDLLMFMTQVIKKNEENPKKVIIAACEYLEENQEFAKLIINNNVDPTFANRLFSVEVIRESFMHRFSANKSEVEQEYIYHFLTYGIFRVVCVWLNKEKRESPQMLAKLIERMLSHISE